MGEFDKALMHLDETECVLSRTSPQVLQANEGSKVIAFERGELLFVFNFHPTESYAHYRFGTSMSGMFQLILDTDQGAFGGDCRLQAGAQVGTFGEQWDGRPHSISLYLPSRSAQVFKLVEEWAQTEDYTSWTDDDGEEGGVWW
ncbi:hypothetical protein CYMTET_26042 [Cymbomonas tetramitiformis]|uniref:Alpha-amylase/branching enzyme C-terminal all beta domain-containing protein n=1 Tax=Cymbomonas tetramitiformis TaxID=36881 RepID=A0AAE0KYG1_9CHLO|nr:hypothetical protein CYMTET_26042 [Cymbomonas tetramitiformis]